MAATTASDFTDGPVLNFINKRLRALRKKHNRITQIEEAVAQGKTIIKEQEDFLRSKPSITAAIDELDKLRQPLSAAVSEEVNLAIQRHQVSSGNNKEDEEVKGSEGQNQVEREHRIIEDLLNLLYFGSMFDVKSQGDYTSTMLTRTHERGCCLTYDYVTDDDTDLLGERDLDLLSKVGGLVISRPVDSVISHKNALQRCIEHAKLWIDKSDEQIDSESSVTYALLREKLTKIMGSDYFTTTPEMKGPLREKLTKIMGSDYFTTTPEMKGPGEVAAAAENYCSFHVPGSVEGSVEEYQQEEEAAAISEGNGTYDDQSSLLEENHKGELEVENSEEVPSHKESSMRPQDEEGQNQRDVDSKEHQYAARRPYQNQRGGRGGGGGGRRGYYSNGRGGRFGGGRGGGPYQNGRNQYYDQPGNYYPRNYYSNSRGRGGGGAGGTSYGHHGSAVQAGNGQADS